MEELLCSVSFSLEDTNREVVPLQSGVGGVKPGSCCPVYSCSPPRFLVRALPHACRASGAAVQLCLQLRTPALSTTHHPPRRPENRRFQRKGAWELWDGWGQTDSKRGGGGLEGHGHITSLHDRSTSLFSSQTLCCSLAQRMLLVASSCSSSCTAAIKPNA